jgi:hypothetical protein
VLTSVAKSCRFAAWLDPSWGHSKLPANDRDASAAPRRPLLS